MIAADVQFYDVVKWLHISAVVVGLGPTFAFGIYLAVIGRNHPRSIPAVLEAQTAVTRSLVSIAILVIIATGIYLTADRWDFGDAFIAVGMAAIIVIIALAFGFFEPNDRRTKEAAERDIAASGGGEVEFGDEFNRRSARSATVGALTGLLIIVTVYFMTAKPFL